MSSHYQTDSTVGQNCCVQSLQNCQCLQIGVTILQIAEGSIRILIRNLKQMKKLAIAAQTQQDSQEKILIEQEFNELVDQNQDIALNTSFNDIWLHRDNQTIAIAVDEELELILRTQSIPEMYFVFHDYNATVTSIETEIDTLSAYQAHLAELMNTVQSHLNCTLNTTAHHGYSIRCRRKDPSESDMDATATFFG